MGYAARTLVEAIPGPAAIVDADGRVLVANGRWRPDGDAAYPGEGVLLADGDAGCPAHGRLLSATRQLTPQSPPTVLACRCDAPGTGVRVAHLESDCGAHRRLVTVESAAANGDAGPDDAAAQAKSQFLALLGHEIRTPVTTVVAAVELLRAQPLQQEVREVVDSVHRSVHALKALTDDLLDLARLETGVLRVEREPVAVRPVLESIVEPLQQQARRKGILLLAAPAPNLPPTVLGDVHRLRQVLTCVVGNAIKFTETGEVIVTAAPDGDDAYQIIVSDTGPGIPASDQARIFAPFVQADPSAARLPRGRRPGPGAGRPARGVHGRHDRGALAAGRGLGVPDPAAAACRAAAAGRAGAAAPDPPPDRGRRAVAPLDARPVLAAHERGRRAGSGAVRGPRHAGPGRRHGPVVRRLARPGGRAPRRHGHRAARPHRPGPDDQHHRPAHRHRPQARRADRPAGAAPPGGGAELGADGRARRADHGAAAGRGAGCCSPRTTTSTGPSSVA
nr:hypothetical protein GCM10020092_066390 [Actinoplanes digitatis]